MVNETLRSRTQAETLRDLGTSLADIAAFMQEVEIKHGFIPKKDDGRGIERIRQMALKLQKKVKGQDVGCSTCLFDAIMSHYSQASAPEVESKPQDCEGGSSEAQTQTESKNQEKT